MQPVCGMGKLGWVKGRIEHNRTNGILYKYCAFRCCHLYECSLNFSATSSQEKFRISSRNFKELFHLEHIQRISPQNCIPLH